MFEGQPKGLYALALANTGERFGYYTMLAIFTLFLQAKFGFTATVTSNIFAGFLALVYFLPVVGGILADKFGFGKMVTSGIVIMFIGYICLAIPAGNNALGIAAMIGSLFLIALGTGLFKGNLQVLVGNLYDDPKYASKRDTAFSIFYMAINIGALFAPTAAEKITDWYMKSHNFIYNGDIPALAHQYLDGSLSGEAMQKFISLASSQGVGTDAASLTSFANDYINVLSESYHMGFAVACVSLIVSMLIYVLGRKTFKHADINNNTKQASSNEETAVHTQELTPAETKSRVIALCLVFAVVIFFWMAFHQNGLTLTFFARDYTAATATGLTRMGFDVWNLVLIAIMVYALFSLFQSKKTKGRVISAFVLGAALAMLYSNYNSMDEVINILPQKFQQFNPFFVVALTPVSMAVFSYLASKGKEPSAPRKIGIGMFIAAVGFMIMVWGSLGLPVPDDLASTTTDYRVTPNLLIGTYLVLTFAELFLSPMGISFVSKVAPPKYKGLMMGGWFAATAVGNYLVSIIGMLWGGLPLWVLWGILVVLCVLSAVFIFSIMKKLEKVC
jgi:POT family proton-dependent oligopeptide transporter